MKILHLESGRRLYGGGRQVVYLMAGLESAGVDNLLVCARGSEIASRAGGTRVIETFRAGGARVVEKSRGGARVVEKPRGGTRVVEIPMSGDLDPRLPARLRRIVEREAPDLVHVHSRRGADLFGGRAARSLGVPAVLTRRVESDEPRAWARFKCRPYSAVVAISRFIESWLIEDLGLERERVRLVPSAVDTALFRPDPRAGARLRRTLGLAGDTRLVGVAAQLIARKGHAVLLESVEMIAERLPSMRVLLFGRGPRQPRLAGDIAARGLAGTVRLLGHREAPERWLPGLDLLVHPALREGLGVAVLEAMSAGVAVVATRAGGLVDAVEHERTGLLVEPGDARGLAGALERMMLDDALRERLAAAGRHRVEAAFSTAAMTERHLELYESILGQRDSAR